MAGRQRLEVLLARFLARLKCQDQLRMGANSLITRFFD
jgi:hypothetical protein